MRGKDNKLQNIGSIIIFFILVFSLLNVFINFETCKAKDANVLYVGGSVAGNYSTIQDAINTSYDGDTVYVYDGIYYENLVINKSIDLIGSDKNSVHIYGDNELYTILIKSSWVNITGFTIQNGKVGIFVSGSEYSFNNITGNIITNNYEGIRFVNSSYNKVINNVILHHSDYGFILYESTNNFISRNNFTDNSRALSFCRWSDNNIVSGNDIMDYNFGICLDFSSNNAVYENSVVDGDYGVYLISSEGNSITNNSIEDNKESGIYISNSDGNTISPNNFLNNYQDVKKESTPPNVKAPGFEILFTFFALVFIMFFLKKKRFKTT